jgi:hypothetical protein
VSPATPLLPRVVLAVVLAGGGCAAFAAALTLAVGHTDGVDSAVFLFAFAVLLPLVVLAIQRERPLPGADAATVAAVANVASIGLTLVLCGARLGDEVAGDDVRSSVIVLALAAMWAGAIATLVVAARRGRPVLGRDGFAAALPTWLPFALLPLVAVALVWGALPEAGTLILSLVLGGALLAAHLLLRPEERIGRWGTLAVDAVVVIAILLLLTDVTVFTPEAAAWGLQPHNNTSLGPANDLLGGKSMLVDAYSIYGVGSMYFFAALFEVVPIGYGAFGLLVAVAMAVMYAIAYAILRLAGCSPFLAAGAMAAAVVSSVFSTVGSPSTFPSLGAMRWGFGYLLVLLAVWAARGGRGPTALRLVGGAIVGIASVWSFEVFVYTGAAYAAIAGYWAAARRAEVPWTRSVAGLLVPAAAACVAAHLALAGWTLAREGQLPSWDPYLAIVREFVTGPYNGLVAPPWWSGIAYGGFLFGSAAAVAAIVLRLPRFEAENRSALVAIAGMTAFGVAIFTYGVRFSHEDYVARADLPGLMGMVLWVHLAARSRLARPARVAIAATAFWVVAVLIAAGWDHVEREAPRTALVTALPGNGRSVGEEVSDVWDNPPIQARAMPAEALLDRYWPDQDRVLVMLHPDLSVETLMRSGRVNELPVSYFLADTLVAEERRDRVLDVVDELEPGTLMLTEGFYLEPGATREYITDDAEQLALEQMVMDRLRERFRLEPVATEEVGFDPTMGDEELIVVRLEDRS